MRQSPVAKSSGDSWARAVVFLLVLVLTSPNLATSTFSNISWAAIVVAAAVLLPYSLRQLLAPRRATGGRAIGKSRRGFPARVPIVIFLTAICLPAVYGAALTPTVVGFGKLATILLIGLSVLASRARLAMSAFYGILAAFWINFAFLLTGMLVGGPTGSIMMAGRWGTLLNHPGALWKIGISIWFFAAYLAVKRRSVGYFALLVASSGLIFLDGARTGLLLALLEGLLLIVVLAAENGRLRLLLVVGGIGAIAFVVFLGGALSAIDLPEEGGLKRVGKLVIVAQGLGTDGLEEADPARFTMLQVVIQAIRDHPFFGTGMQSTTSGTVNIHMSYLQVWANLGLLGLVSYVWLMWGWLSWCPNLLRRIRELKDDRSRALYYNALLTLLVCGLGACTCPLGNEWSDWTSFLVSYALLWHFINSRSKPDEHACLASPSPAIELRQGKISMPFPNRGHSNA